MTLSPSRGCGDAVTCCSDCNGDGVITINPAYPDIRGEIDVRCDTCRGAGSIPYKDADHYDRVQDARAEHLSEFGEESSPALPVGPSHSRTVRSSALSSRVTPARPAGRVGQPEETPDVAAPRGATRRAA